jgi:hypothetical protein
MQGFHNDEGTMSSKSERRITIFFALYVAAGGVHYFLSGEDLVSSTLRNALVIIQIVAGVGVACLIWWRGRRSTFKA